MPGPTSFWNREWDGEGGKRGGEERRESACGRGEGESAQERGEKERERGVEKVQERKRESLQLRLGGARGV